MRNHKWTRTEAKHHIIEEAMRFYGFAPRMKDIDLIYWSREKTLFTVRGKKYCLKFSYFNYILYRVLD